MTATVQMRGITTVDLAKRTKRRRGYIPQDEITYDTATVIAIDPGGTTGWSLMQVDPEALCDRSRKVLPGIFDHQHGQVDCGVRRGNLDTTLHAGISTDGEFAGVYDIAKLCREWPCAAVVIEDFQLRQMRRDRELLSPVRIGTAIGYTLWIQGRDYFVQQPADAKNVCSDALLKEAKMYDPYGNLVHARDADRHALLFLRKLKTNADLRERAFPFLFGPDGPYYQHGTPRTTQHN